MNRKYMKGFAFGLHVVALKIVKVSAWPELCRTFSVVGGVV